VANDVTLDDVTSGEVRPDDVDCDVTTAEERTEEDRAAVGPLFSLVVDHAHRQCEETMPKCSTACKARSSTRSSIPSKCHQLIESRDIFTPAEMPQNSQPAASHGIVTQPPPCAFLWRLYSVWAGLKNNAPSFFNKLHTQFYRFLIHESYRTSHEDEMINLLFGPPCNCRGDCRCDVERVLIAPCTLN